MESVIENDREDESIDSISKDLQIFSLYLLDIVDCPIHALRDKT